MPEPYGVVWALSRHFVPAAGRRRVLRRADDGPRLAPAAINDPTSPYRPHLKAAHRADPDDRRRARVAQRLRATGWRALPHWHPAEVLHFPFRSLEQWERKGVRRARGDKPLGQYVRALHASEAGRADDRYRALLVDDDDARARACRRRRSWRTRGCVTRSARLGAGRADVPAQLAAADLETCGRSPRRAAIRDADVVRLQSTPGRAPIARPRRWRTARPGTARRLGSRRREARLDRSSLRDDADVLDAHLAFHLNAGVDLVLVAGARRRRAYRRGPGAVRARTATCVVRARRARSAPSYGPAGRGRARRRLGASEPTPTSSGGRAARA